MLWIDLGLKLVSSPLLVVCRRRNTDAPGFGSDIIISLLPLASCCSYTTEGGIRMALDLGRIFCPSRFFLHRREGILMAPGFGSDISLPPPCFLVVVQLHTIEGGIRWLALGLSRILVFLSPRFLYLTLTLGPLWKCACLLHVEYADIAELQ